MADVYHDVRNPSPCLWVACSDGNIPDDHPVVGGNEGDGSPIYVARVLRGGDTIPGKAVPKHRRCFVSHGGKEHIHESYQVLTNPQNTELVWIPSGHGDIPEGAILGGQQFDGTPLYIGRVHHCGSMTVGKVHPKHGNLYIPFGGKEVAYPTYSVLCTKNNMSDFFMSTIKLLLDIYTSHFSK